MDSLNKLKNNWNSNESCSLVEIDNFIKSTGWNINFDYQNFLLWSNGGEGYVGNNYMSFWRLENLIQLNKDYQIQKYLGNNCLAFGTDGGGICYGFDFNFGGHIFRCALGDLDPNEKKKIANSFEEFITIALEKDLSE